ncbi:zinc metalloprotease [Legionella rubrilucens]|uniref:Zinc metalloprotease n=1 Tax=Legionella rubrilucens TaxID=458 RepID=A0A0W0XZK6_9GAMM|nr:SprT family zinc-dependent metalloprotease [Legionella rubrilucens]KTD49748.1 zinc metalloprotease [Legionella rubrilucens]
MVHSVFEIRGLRCELVRKPIKNLHLRVYPPDGRIRVSAPLRMNQKTIEQFIIAKQDWIEQSRQRFLSRMPSTQRHYNDGEIHYLFGHPCILTIKPTSKRPFCSLNEPFLCLNIAAEASYDDKASLVQRWYREQLRQQLNELIPRWEKIIGVKAHAIGIKKMKTRWGSCNTRTARVWFSLMLAEKPLACVEYVVVHELVHLLEASHNHRFHGFMNQFLPDWQKRKALLNG